MDVTARDSKSQSVSWRLREEIAQRWSTPAGLMALSISALDASFCRFAREHCHRAVLLCILHLKSRTQVALFLPLHHGRHDCVVHRHFMRRLYETSLSSRARPATVCVTLCPVRRYPEKFSYLTSRNGNQLASRACCADAQAARNLHSFAHEFRGRSSHA